MNLAPERSINRSLMRGRGCFFKASGVEGPIVCYKPSDLLDVAIRITFILFVYANKAVLHMKMSKDSGYNWNLTP